MDHRARHGLEDYLTDRLGGQATIRQLSRPSANGFSADTYILEVEVEQPRAVGPSDSGVEHLVVQAAPRTTGLFAHYDLGRSFRVQQALTPFAVPVAGMRWLCEDLSRLGVPFYVMDFVPGQIPPDRPPYHVEGWMYDRPGATRRAIWLAGIDAIGALHRVPIERFAFLAEGEQADPAGQRLDRWHRFGVELGADIDPALLAALERLDERRPAPGELRVHWGDAKLGNMIFGPDRVAAILDWELTGLSVGEEDLAHWMAVDWFLSTGIGHQRLDGLPGPGETIERYESVVDRPTDSVEWWFIFALVRMGLIFQRAAVQSRLRRGGGGSLRANAIVPHLDALLGGTTWAEYGGA